LKNEGAGATGGADSGKSDTRISVDQRISKVGIEDFASMPGDFSWYPNLRAMLPRILRGRDLEDLAQRVAVARAGDRPVMLMMGAHVIKVGLGGLISEMIRRGVFTAVATNGAGAIHDLEIALWGRTSEDVAAGLESGQFGMVRETAEIFNTAALRCLDSDTGLGEALGRRILEDKPRNAALSVMCTACQQGLPATVHVAIGTDVVHQHKEADGRAIGQGTMTDFRRFAASISALEGGVVINAGSAVVMPEVFLKALAMARNSGARLADFTTANFDMISHYRPRVNVVERPRVIGATSFSFLGNHEILLPVFMASVLAKMGV
jgi:hypothetical protein